LLDSPNTLLARFDCIANILLHSDSYVRLVALLVDDTVNTRLATCCKIKEINRRHVDVTVLNLDGELTRKSLTLQNWVLAQLRSGTENAIRIVELVGVTTRSRIPARQRLGLAERTADVILLQHRAFAGDFVRDVLLLGHAGLEVAAGGGSRGSEGDEAQEEEGLHVDVHDDGGKSKEKMCK
jgi:hypothetical protein